MKLHKFTALFLVVNLIIAEKVKWLPITKMLVILLSCILIFLVFCEVITSKN